MLTRSELNTYLEQLLGSSAIDDYCPNGLQVEGRAAISKVVTGVTASQALIEAAVDCKADAILVHHGYFWKSEDKRITGSKKSRISALMRHDINLFAYHLPLDVHPTFGNNAQLAKRLGIQTLGQVAAGGIRDLVYYGQLAEQMSAKDFAALLAKRLGRAPLHVCAERPVVQRLAWCSGAAQGFLNIACSLDVDAYISGEVSEATYHDALENNLHYYAAGHHATERYGVQALGEHLAERFGIAHQFIDIPNPV